MAVGAVRACDRDLLLVIVEKCGFFGMGYVWPSQNTLLGWYNQKTGRNVKKRTLNYMLARIDYAKLLKRICRSFNDPVLGHVLQSTIYVPLKSGLIMLERFGIMAFAIVKKISEVFRPRKKRTRRVGSRRVRLGSSEPVGSIVGDVLKGLKGL
jgi:hypothetical protein